MFLQRLASLIILSTSGWKSLANNLEDVRRTPKYLKESMTLVKPSELICAAFFQGSIVANIIWDVESLLIALIFVKIPQKPLL